MAQTADSHVLIGREVEIDRLSDVLSEARSGGTVSLALVGDAGVGKTSIVKAAARLASGAGFTVFSLSCTELSMHRPLGAWTDGLAGLVPDGEQTATVVSVGADTAYTTAVRVLDLARERGPAALVCIEDVHWADDATFEVLRHLLVRPHGDPLLVVATIRTAVDDAARGRVAELLDAVDHVLTVEGLDPDASRELLERLVGRTPGDRLVAMAARARGNPLYITEIVRGLREDGALVDQSGRVDAASDRLPSTVNDVVGNQLRRLDVETRGMLRLATALGPTFRVAELEVAAGRPPAEFLSTLDSALVARVLQAEGEELSFRHALVRDAIYEALPAPVRVAVHRHVARALQRAGFPASVTAPHYLIGAERGDLEAAEVLLAAARDALVASPDEALRLLDARAAIVTGEDLPADLVRLEALASRGAVDEAVQLSGRLAAEVQDPAGFAAVRHRRAALLLIANRPRDAGEELLAAAPYANDDDASGMLAEAALCFLAAADPELAERWSRAAIDRAGRTGVGLPLALCVQSRLAAHRLDLAESLHLARRASAAAAADGRPEASMYQPTFFEALALHDLDRLEDTIAAARAAQVAGRSAASTAAAPIYHAITAFAHLRAGRILDAESSATEAVASCARASAPLAGVWSHGLAALVAMHAGDASAAVASVDAGEALVARSTPLLGLDVFVLAQARVQERNGRVAGARETLRDAVSVFLGIGVPGMAAVLAPDVARLAAAAGDDAMADEAIGVLRDVAGATGLAAWRAAAVEAEGVRSGDAALLRAAVELHRSSPRRLEHARAAEAASLATAKAGGGPARELAEESLDLYATCGAWADWSLARRAFRDAGLRVSRPRARTPAGRGSDALTPAERAVVDLVIEGLGNVEIAARLFLSRRTVEAHLYRVFAKLGVRSRSELVARLRES